MFAAMSLHFADRIGSESSRFRGEVTHEAHPPPLLCGGRDWTRAAALRRPAGAAGQPPVAASAYSPRCTNTWAETVRFSPSPSRQHNPRLPQLRSLARDMSGDHFPGPRASGPLRTVAADGCVQINPAQVHGHVDSVSRRSPIGRLKDVARLPLDARLWRPSAGAGHARRCSRPGAKRAPSLPTTFICALRHLCELSGLQAIELEQHGGLPQVIVEPSFKSLDVLPRPFPVLLQPFRTVSSLISRTRSCRWSSWRARESFPLDYVLVAAKPQ